MRHKQDREFCDVLIRFVLFLLKKHSPHVGWNTSLVAAYGLAFFVCLQLALILSTPKPGHINTSLSNCRRSRSNLCISSFQPFTTSHLDTIYTFYLL